MPVKTNNTPHVGVGYAREDGQHATCRSGLCPRTGRTDTHKKAPLKALFRSLQTAFGH